MPQKITYVPRYLAIDPFEFTFSADAVERLKASRVQRSLKIHVLNVEVHVPASLDALHTKVEPRAEARVLVVRHRVTRQPNVKLCNDKIRQQNNFYKCTYVVAAVHLLTACHVSRVKVTCNGHVLLADFEVVRRSLRIHITQLFICEVAHDALNALSLILLRIFVIYVALGVSFGLAI